MTKRHLDSQQKIIDSATLLIFDYMNSNEKEVDEFCKRAKISKDLFEQAIKIVEDKVPNLYKEYENSIQKKEKKKDLNIKSKLKKIIELIINGIKINDNESRPFEYLDFCLITNLTINKFYELCQKYNVINADNIKYIKSFIIKNRENYKLNREELMNEKFFIKIEDDYREVTELEKLQILAIIYDLKFPMETKIYKQLSRRYLTGSFNLNKIEKVRIKSNLNK